MINVINVDGYLPKRFDNNLNYSNSGNAYLRFYMPMSNGGNKTAKTTWVNVTLFGKNAEYFHNYNNVGDYVCVSGKIVGKFDENGKQNGIEILGDNLTLISKQKISTEDTSVERAFEKTFENPKPQQSTQSSQPTKTQQFTQQPVKTEEINVDDDDLPF